VSKAAPVDVVVVTWNSREIALRCLERLSLEVVRLVVIVDNGSQDGTADAIRARRPDVELVRLARSQSLSAAYNRGAERGSAQLVLFLNDDVLASEGSIRRLAGTLLERADAVAVAGRLVDPGTNHTQQPYQPRRFPTFATFAKQFAGRAAPSPVADETATVPVDQPVGACLLVRRAALEAVGGWDEQFEFWYEDVDLARRLRRLGLVLFVPAAPFEHVGGWSARRLSRAELVGRHYRGALLYASKHFGALERVGTGLLYGTVAAARIAVSPRDRASRIAYARVLSSSVRLVFGRRLSPP
jgi:GT2 family glycosyltransferase